MKNSDHISPWNRKSRFSFESSEERDAYTEMAKKEDGIYYRRLTGSLFVFEFPKCIQSQPNRRLKHSFCSKKERAEFVRRTGKMAQSSRSGGCYIFQNRRKNKDFQMHSNMICQVVFWNVWSGMRIQLAKGQKEMIVECLERD